MDTFFKKNLTFTVVVSQQISVTQFTTCSRTKAGKLCRLYTLIVAHRGSNTSIQGTSQQQSASPTSSEGTDLITSDDFKQMRSNSTPHSGGKS